MDPGALDADEIVPTEVGVRLSVKLRIKFKGEFAPRLAEDLFQ